MIPSDGEGGPPDDGVDQGSDGPADAPGDGGAAEAGAPRKRRRRRRGRGERDVAAGEPSTTGDASPRPEGATAATEASRPEGGRERRQYRVPPPAGDPAQPDAPPADGSVTTEVAGSEAPRGPESGRVNERGRRRRGGGEPRSGEPRSGEPRGGEPRGGRSGEQRGGGQRDQRGGGQRDQRGGQRNRDGEPRTGTDPADAASTDGAVQTANEKGRSGPSFPKNKGIDIVITTVPLPVTLRLVALSVSRPLARAVNDSPLLSDLASSFGGPVAISTLGFMLLTWMFWVLNPGRSDWVSVVIGGLTATGLVTLISFALRWWFEISGGGSAVYGFLAAFIGVLLFLNLASMAIVYGAHIAASIRLKPWRPRGNSGS